MSSEDQSPSANEKTARTVGQLVKYSREVNQSDTVGEVGTYALEATFHVMDGHPSPTVFEVLQGEARVLESMSPTYGTGDPAGPIPTTALEAGETVAVVRDDVALDYETDDLTVLEPDDLDGDSSPPAVSLAAPSFRTDGASASDAATDAGAAREGDTGSGDDGASDVDEGGESGVILLVEWDAIDAIEAYHVKPVEYLADHVATAVANVRSRERLERARNDLAKRKEMIEMYDRLLRHDLGNDLQVITGFSDALVTMVDSDDEQLADYAEKIFHTSKRSADLIGRVGELVKTLEKETEPEPRDLAPIVSDVVEDVDTKFESLSVEYDPADFGRRVFAGDLLDSVFRNVLSNAAVHNEGPVTVEVYAVEPTPDTIAVGFADDGGGVAEEVRDEIFEIGKKGPDSDGTGFGLGIARALVESYGGTVAVGESDRGGADFRITLECA